MAFSLSFSFHTFETLNLDLCVIMCVENVVIEVKGEEEASWKEGDGAFPSEGQGGATIGRQARGGMARVGVVLGLGNRNE